MTRNVSKEKQIKRDAATQVRFTSTCKIQKICKIFLNWLYFTKQLGLKQFKNLFLTSSAWL